MSTSVDLNCDLGESFGPWRMGNDEAILDHVTSANVACGFHAGDPSVIHKTVEAALSRGVAVGAHPALPDLQGFGRRTMQITSREAYDLVLYQVGALAAFCRAGSGRLSHVKPHGALYNMAATDRALAEAIAGAVRDFDASLVLFGLAGSELVRAGQAVGLAIANEVFADRTYQADGTLTPRSRPNAIIEDIDTALAQVERMVLERRVAALGGGEVAVVADTICIHGDEPDAPQFARRIRAHLKALGVTVRAPGPHA